MEKVDRQLKVSIGINIGETIKEEEDFFGSAVVLAARIMNLAIGGQILVSDLFRKLAGTTSGFQYIDYGWKQLKAEDEMSFAISPPAKTTIAGISLYDNFWWPKTSKEVVNGSGTVFEFDNLMYPRGSRKEINRLTSDHRPVSIRVIVYGQDDD